MTTMAPTGKASRTSVINHGFVVVLALLLLLLGALATWFESRSADTFMRTVMMSEAQMLARALDAAVIKRLSGTAKDVQSPDYHYLRAKLTRIREANPRYRYLYLMGRRPGSDPFFFMGTAPDGSPDYTPPGTVYYEDSPTLKAVLSTRKGMISPPFSDRWGTWISALIPITDEHGGLIAVFGMDFDAADWRMYVVSRLITPIAITGFTVILLFAVVAMLRHQQSLRENAELAAITAELEKTRLLLESIIEQSPVAMVVYEKPEGTLRYLNQAMRALIGAENEPSYAGLTLDKPGERRTWRYLAQDGREAGVEQMAASQALQGKSVEGVEACFERADGSSRWVLASGKPIIDRSGAIIAAFGVYSDITERKRAEELVKKSLAEKEVLLKEIHHRVKNNMQIISSLMSLQADALKDPAVHDALRASQNRVKSMALIHEHLYQSENLAEIDFSEYARILVSGIMHMYPAGVRITTDVRIRDVRLDIDRAIPCGLIMNELVSNCVKHGFPDGREGRIEVAMNGTDDGRYELIVADDGVGGVEETDSGSSLGMMLVRSLVSQLKGHMRIESTAGTRITIVF